LVLFILGTLVTSVIYLSTPKFPNPSPPAAAQNLNVSVFRRLENGELVTSEISLNTSDTLFYVDFWRAHWCPYYNDRAFFLTPRLNEILHLARSRGFRAFHLHWKPHESKLDKELRAEAEERAAKGETEIIRVTWTDNTKNNSKYIPGFQDRCMLPGYERFGPTRNQKPHPSISVSKSDSVAFNFKSIANIAHFLNISTVILMGIHTNLCIRSAAMYLALVNISVGYVEDLLDAGFYFPGQKKHGVRSHSKMNKVAYNYSILYHGWGVGGFDLMRALYQMPAVTREPEWAMYPETAIQFRRYYSP
jgi:nicotinamidase-related amidase